MLCRIWSGPGLAIGDPIGNRGEVAERPKRGMGGRTPVQNRMLRAAAALAAIGFVTACEAPTPTASNGDAPNVAAPGPDTPQGAPVANREARQIVVEAGQSVSRIAVKYGLSKRAIIAANNLTPPYKIKIGQQLLIPSADGPPPAPAAAGSPAPEIIAL